MTLLRSVLGRLRQQLCENSRRRSRREFARAVLSRRRQSRIESLETRALLTVFPVINTADSGAGSFRQAILDANANLGPDVIEFNIGGGGLQSIAPTSAGLPIIVEELTIDATTQPGFAGNPLIELRGDSLPLAGSDNGLRILSSNVAIRGLIINRFYVGLSIEATDAQIQGNWIGTDSTGNAAAGNRFTGVYVQGADSLVLGGTTSAERNVISGNSQDFSIGGINFNGAPSVGALVVGNYIGLGADGSTVVPNLGPGVAVDVTHNTTVRGNVISGNTGPGVTLSDGLGLGNNNFVEGNIIGLDAAGVIAKPNAFGVYVSSPFNTIGGSTPGSGNIISGNTTQGIALIGAAAANNLIAGNFIGTDKDGVVAIPNQEGILIEGDAHDNQIGGALPLERNVISGNSAGVYAAADAGTGNQVIGNLIGVDGRSTPQGAVGWWRGENNANDFLGLNNGTVQGTVPFVPGTGTGKVGGVFQFDGNTSNYIQVANSPSLEPTAAVTIDTWVRATAPGVLRYIVAKGGDDTSASYALYTDDASGGLRFYVRTGAGLFRTADAGPAIWNNTWRHVVGTYDGTRVRLYVDGVEVGAPVAASGNITYGLSATNDLFLGHYQGNSFQLSFTGVVDEPTVYNRALNANEVQTIYGMDEAGKAGFRALPNVFGVQLDGADNIDIGNDVLATAGNVISGNSLHGVFVVGTATGNHVLGNKIGTDPSGTAAIPNVQSGVRFDAGAANNFVGGQNPFSPNVISGNGDIGIELMGAGTAGNLVQGNLVGTDINGALSLRNSGGGIRIRDGASSNTIGGGVPEAGNIISGHNNGLSAAITLVGAGTNANKVQGNYIGTDKSGLNAIPNTYGVFLFGAKGSVIGVDGDNALDTGERNVISGNLAGVWLQSDSDNTVIAGNLIGLTKNGDAILPGMQQGIRVFEDLTTTGTRIGTNSDGTSDTLERNVIAGASSINVFLPGTSNNRVSGNFIGTNALGTAALGNTFVGISLSAGSTFNLIGSDGDGVRDDVERNLISGHSNVALSLSDASTRDNTIAGNDVGLNAAGDAAIANVVGISIAGAIRNTIGGQTVGARNIITGNSSNGILLELGASDNTVIGNYVGTNKNGTAAIGNTTVGIAIDASSNNDIGGLVPGQGNLISGSDFGVSIIGAAGGNFVRGNVIGLNQAGNAAISNSEGIHITATLANTIGGTSAEARNIIGGNSSYDVTLLSNSQIVQGNWIGINATGTAGMQTNLARVLVNGGSTNTLGGTAPGAGNVISGNTLGPGVWLTGNALGNVVQGNFIGSNPAGTIALGNQQGISIDNLSSSNIIGGHLGSGGNLISGNLVGIDVNNSSSNILQGNLIGTTAAGSSGLANANGIQLQGNADSNRIGGFTSTLGNVISGNSIDGILLLGAGITNTSILSNKIGTNATGTAAVANSSKGINIQNAVNTVIGAAGSGNVISGNDTGAIEALGAPGTKVQANLIGTDYLGQYAIANGGQHAVRFTGFIRGLIGTDGNGQDDELEGNVISGNAGNGVRLQGGSGTFGEHTVAGNIIGLNSAGTAAIANAGIGLSILVSEKNRIDSNIVSGNASYGIDLFDSSNLGRTRENTIVNNVVGTDKLGSQAFSNLIGIQLRSAADNTISDNLISGNAGSGVFVTQTTSVNNLFSGNTIGLDSDGTYAIPNGESGLVLLAAGTGNIVSGNVISGNQGTGLDGAGIYNLDTDGTVIIDNRIGTNRTGEAAIGNEQHGIVASGSNVRIGTDGDGTNDFEEGNLISGNGSTGITIGGSSNPIQNYVIAGNNIGTNLSGDRRLDAQTQAGIHIEPLPGSGVIFMRIGTNGDGTSDALERNVISGSLGNGIAIVGADVSNVTIRGNFIGTDWSGSQDLGNGGTGVTISGSSIDTVEANTISGNQQGGLLLNANAFAVSVLANTIGTSTSGLIALGNGTTTSAGFGIKLDNASSNVIGGNVANRNLISANLGDGVIVQNGSQANTITFNWIGANAIDSTSLGNSGNAVHLSGATTTNNTVQQNSLYYNSGAALRLEDSTSTTASGNQFDLNSYRNNLGLTVDIGSAGPTLNDGLDSNPSNLRDFPIITSAALVGDQLEISGFSQPGRRVDVYLSAPALSGRGQAQELIAAGLIEGSASDLDAGSGNYDAPYAAATISANRYRFRVPVTDSIRFGTLITAVSIGSISEFGNVVSIGLSAADMANNLAPQITLPANATLSTGQTLHLDGSFLDDDSTDWTATVDYGDGSGVKALVLDKISRTFTLEHVYTSMGVTPYTLTVLVQDNGGKSGMATAAVLVQNEAPEITYNKFTITSKVAEGGFIALDGLFTDTGLTDQHVVTIDWGDGQIVSSGIANPDIAAIPVGSTSFRATHQYIDDGVSNTPRDSYRVLVTVTDNGNLSDTSPDGLFVIEVLNVRPSNIVAGLPTVMNENDLATLSGTFVDPGTLDKHTVRVNWGDGKVDEFQPAVGQRTFNLQHRYLDNARAPATEYLVTIEVSDDDEPLLPTTLAKSITVLNRRPVIAASNLTLSANSINEGQSISLDASFADVGTKDKHQLVIDWGDGSENKVIDLAAGVTSVSGITHTYVDDPAGVGPNTFLIAVKVRDFDMSDNDFETATTTLTVNNLAPSFVVPTTGPAFVLTNGTTVITGGAVEGDRVTLSGSYADPGIRDVPIVTIQWGDGTSSQAQVNPSTHTFKATHLFQDDNEAAGGQISLTLDDQDGGVVTSTTTLLVSNAAPTVRIVPGNGNTQSQVALNALASDLGSSDIPTLQYTWTVQVQGSGNSPILTGQNSSNLSIDRNGNFADPYRITLQVTDDEGGMVSASTHLIVLDDTPNIFAPAFAAQPVGVGSVTILGLAGSDTLNLSNWTIPVILDGGADTDTLIGGSADDTLILHQGDDSGLGGLGSDRYVMTFNSTLTVDDTAGANILDFSPTGFGVTFDLNLAVTSTFDVQDVLPANPGLHYADIDGTFAQLIGTGHADRLTGSSGALIDGAAGADRLFAPAGISSSLQFRGGADDDVLTVDFGSTVTNIDFEGDVGADDFLILGDVLNSVDFNGGADDDVLTVGLDSAINQISFEGDVGADDFLIFGDVLTSVDFNGGADDDLLSVDLSSILGSVSFEGDLGADEFILSGNVLNSIDFEGGADDDVLTVELGASVNTVSFEGDVGADEFTIFGSIVTVDFDGGADDDVLTVELGSTLTSVSFEGDIGADDFLIFGQVVSVDFEGGADKDALTIELGSSVTSVSFEGDIGADDFLLLGTVLDIVDFNGGADSDLFYMGVSAVADQVSFEGDLGRDRIELLGRVLGQSLGDIATIPNVPGLVPARDFSVFFAGGQDDDVLILGADSFANSVSFEGDVGADDFYLFGTVTVMVDFGGGADDDLLVLGDSAISNQVSFEGDVGADQFLIDSSSLISVVFDGGADDDLLTLSVDASLLSVSFEGDVGADDFIILGDVLTTVDFNGGADDDVLLVGLDSVLNQVSFEGDVGADEFVINGSVTLLIDFNGGADDDLLQLGESSLAGAIDFEGDVGADDLLILGDVINSVDFSGGADNDRLLNRASGFHTLTFYGYIGPTALSAPGDGKDLLVNAGSDIQSIRFFGGQDDDVLYSFGNSINQISFEGDVGADVFVIDGSSINQVDFSGGADDDVLSLAGTDFLTISFEGDASSGSGNDTLVNRAAGASETSSTPATITFRGFGGIDAFRNDAGGWDSILFQGGNDADAFQNNANEQNHIRFEGGLGDDVFENNGHLLIDVTVLGDGGDDTFVNDGDQTSGFSFEGGAGDDLFLNTGEQLSNVTFDGGSHDDTIVNLGSNLSGLTFLAGSGNDHWFNAGRALVNARMMGDQGVDEFINRLSGAGANGVRFEVGVGDAESDRLVNLADNVTGLYFEGGSGSDSFENRGLNLAQVEFWGGADDDRALNLGAGLRSFTMTAGSGNDTFENRGDGAVDLRMLGESGNDTLIHRGKSASRSNPTDTNSVAIDMDGGPGVDVLANFGFGTDSIRLVGGGENDRVLNDADQVRLVWFVGGAGNDAMQNNGSDISVLRMNGQADDDSLFNNGSRIGLIDFSGEGGSDTLINTGSSIGDSLAGPTSPTGIVFVGGDQADLLRTQGTNLVRLMFDSGNGDDALLYNAVGGQVNYLAGSGDDIFAYRGTNSLVNFEGASGKDRVVYSGITPNLGTVTTTLTGGLDDDRYEFGAGPQGFVRIVEDYAGLSDASKDALDFSAFNGGDVNLDLASISPQTQPAGLTIQLSSTMGIENVVGSSGADTLLGNDRNNYVGGAAYFYPVTVGTSAAQNRPTQWVYLDFDSQTDALIGEHVYTAAERLEIIQRIEAVYYGYESDGITPRTFSSPDRWFNVRFTSDLNEINNAGVSEYVTIRFNGTTPSGRPGGDSSEIDLGNQSYLGTAIVQVNGLLGGVVVSTPANQDFTESLPEDAEQAVGQDKPPATSENFVALSAKIAAHELGHILGLRHYDAFGPVGFGIHSPPGIVEFKPTFPGASAAFETFDHIIGSPASVGSTRANDIGQLFFGEREAVKLAMGMSDPTVVTATESALPNRSVPIGSSTVTARQLQLATIQVPNTLLKGVNSAQNFYVQATSVTGAIGLNGATSENDYYAFQGQEGDLVTIEISSEALRRYFSQGVDATIDSILRLRDASGQLVQIFGVDAINDDEFESTDSLLMDVRLPASGWYSIEVDTFHRVSSDPDYQTLLDNIAYLQSLTSRTPDEQALLDKYLDSRDDTDVGNYQLSIYNFAKANRVDLIDTLQGRNGIDILDGGPGDDYSVILGSLPTGAVSQEGANYTYVATFADRGAAQWQTSINYGDGSPVTVLAGVTPLTGIPLNHVFADNGTYSVTISVTNDDGVSASASYTVTVSNVAPTPAINSISATRVVGTPIVVAGSATDAAGTTDTITLSWSVFVGSSSTPSFIGTGSSFTFTPVVAGSYLIRLTASDEDGGSNATTSTINVIGSSNNRPTLTITAPADTAFFDTTTIQLNAVDPDAVDQAGPFTYVINWGDGNVQTVTGPANKSVSHVYTKVSATGSVTITATATDPRGLTSDIVTREIIVLGWTVMLDPLSTNPDECILVIVGSNGSDSIRIKEKHDDYLKIRIKDREENVRYRGTIHGDVDHILIFGHGGDDDITLDDDIEVDAIIWGGAGDDKIKGGEGNDIIFGDSGNDVLYGLEGRDILIGGLGADRIYGDSQDDILIAGYTLYDSSYNQVNALSFIQRRMAIEAIMNEWASSRSYAERRNNILGVGSGTAWTNRKNGNTFLRSNLSVAADNTVFDDADEDQLWGDSGVDWFFANINAESGTVLDRIRDRSSSETQQDIDRWW